MSVNNPTLSTTPDQTSVTLGPPVTLKDTADLEGGSNPTGIITFTLVRPGGTTDVDNELVLVNGNCLYSTTTGLTPGVTPSGSDLPGTYQWNATYSGDDIIFLMIRLPPRSAHLPYTPLFRSLSTTPDQTSVTLGPPVTLHDAAFLQGGFNPKGTITFT